MKKIHLIPTDKPSKVLYNSTSKSFCIQKEIDGMFINDGKVSGADFWGLEKALNNGFEPHNIYITSDEEIQEGDWVYCNERKLFGKVIEIQLAKFKSDTSMLYFEINNEEIWCKLLNCKKIILTTDQDLIKDGVQAIDDEFLEWFLKNPSCEEIKIESLKIGDGKLGYVICKPKQDYNGVHFTHCYQGEYEDCCKYGYDNCPAKTLEEPKQETIEEAAERLYSGVDRQVDRMLFIAGAYWQAERMYSEEEVEVIAKDAYSMGRNNILIGVFNKWLKQFKKK